MVKVTKVPKVVKLSKVLQVPKVLKVPTTIFAKKHMFYKNVRISGSKGTPDMISMAFYVKFRDQNEGVPPKACRPPTDNATNSKTKQCIRK